MSNETPEQYARRWHAKQVRKYTGEPYINHPLAVKALVRGFPHTQDMLDAAVLHDTVEDTGATLNEIEFLFGMEVAAMVSMLTDVSKPEDGNRATRKAIDLRHTATASPEAQTVKLADLIDNSRSIIAHDQAFARVYIPEKLALLQVLTKGDPLLWSMAMTIVENAMKELGLTATI